MTDACAWRAAGARTKAPKSAGKRQKATENVRSAVTQHCMHPRYNALCHEEEEEEEEEDFA